MSQNRLVGLRYRFFGRQRRHLAHAKVCSGASPSNLCLAAAGCAAGYVLIGCGCLGGRLPNDAKSACNDLLLWMRDVQDIGGMHENVRPAQICGTEVGHHLCKAPCESACRTAACAAAPASSFAGRTRQQLRISRLLAEQSGKNLGNFKNGAIVQRVRVGA
jgi:hypothetical protein